MRTVVWNLTFVILCIKNRELNKSVEHLENEDMKANIVQPTSKSTAENQDDPEVAMAEVTDISPETYLESAEESNEDSDKSPAETKDDKPEKATNAEKMPKGKVTINASK